jgi:Protein of unknown function (DUF3667)
MTKKNCLNCGKVLTDNYCSHCGQKADTHRITFKNFVSHDILHGIFHFDNGMLFTAKQALIRPGKAALDYISGKRKPYYNVFYLTLITIGLIIFFRHFNDQLDGEPIEATKPQLNHASKTFDDLFSQKSKIIIFLFVPLAALNSWLLFKRKKLNLSEHAIIAGMVLLGMLLISAFGNLFFYFDLIFPFSHAFASTMSYLITLLVVIQVGFGYINAFHQDYTRWGIAFRIALFYALTVLEIMTLFFIAFGVVTNWKFGSVNISPF